MKKVNENQNETSSGTIITKVNKHKEVFWTVFAGVLVIIILALIFG